MTTHGTHQSLDPPPESRPPATSRPKSLRERQLRKDHALKTVDRYLLLAGAVALIPAPFFGQVAIGGLLARMLHDLCELYGAKLADQKVKGVIAAVLGGAHSGWISSYLAQYVDKAFPGTLAIATTVTRPVVAVSVTYAIGMLFVHHLDTGAWLKKGVSRRASPSGNSNRKGLEVDTT